MPSIADIRKQYPQYNNLSAQQLSDALYNKFYAGKIGRDQFNAKLGVQPAGAQASAPVPTGAVAPAPAPAQSSGSPLDGISGALSGAWNQVSQMGQNVANIPGALATQGQQVASDPGSIPDRFNAFASGMMNGIPIAGPFITNGMNTLKANVQTALGNPETPQQRADYEQSNRAKYPTEATEGGVAGTVAPFAIGGATSLGAKLLGLEGTTLGRIGFGLGSQYGIDTGDNMARGQSPGQAAQNAIVPSLIGGGISGLFGGRLSRDAVTNDAASTLQNVGVPLTTAQKTGSALALQAENRGIGPFGMSASGMAGKQADAITRAALEPAGIASTRATPDVMASAYRDFNQQFRDMGASTDVPYDPKLQQRLQDVVTDYHDSAVQTAPIVGKFQQSIDKIATNNGGVISGDQYQSIRSQIGEKIEKTHNPDTRDALTLMQDALDDGVARNMGGNELNQWQQLRRQYKNFVVARNALPAGSAEAAQGIITPANLAKSVQRNEGQLGWTIGRGDSNDLAHAAMQVAPLNPTGLGGHLISSGVGAALAGGAGLFGMHAGLGPELGALAAGAAIPAMTGGAMLAGRSLSGVPQAAMARALLAGSAGS